MRVKSRLKQQVPRLREILVGLWRGGTLSSHSWPCVTQKKSRVWNLCPNTGPGVDMLRCLATQGSRLIPDFDFQFHPFPTVGGLSVPQSPYLECSVQQDPVWGGLETELRIPCAVLSS